MNAVMTPPVAQRWSRDVESSLVQGHPCKVYAHRPRSLAELLVDARRWRHRSFLVEGERRLSFADHEAAVARVAVCLRDSGVRRGDRVMLLAYNRLEWIVAFWAVQSLGAVAVLGNALWSRREAEDALAVAMPTLVLTDRQGDRALPEHVAVMAMDTLREVIDHPEVALLPETEVDEDDAAIIMFSSGTTGVAKGVVMSHRGVIANIQNLLVLTGRLPVELDPDAPGTVSLLTVPLFHLAGVQISFTTLLSGGLLVLLEGRFEPEKVLRLIEREKVRAWGSVPTMVSRVIEHERFGDFDTSSLRSIPMGGAAVSPELRAKIVQVFPAIQKRVGSLYGLTEAGGVLAAGSGADVQDRPGCVGRPLPVVELRFDKPDAKGVGEVLARTPSMTLGYLGEHDPIGDAQGWIRTGDLGRLDDEGRLYIVGRSKDIIIRGGENIASPHVERCLLTHPAVVECAVVPLPHADLGEEVAAAVVVKPGMEVTVEALREHAATRLGKFQIPTRWHLQRENLPTNASGKILKRSIAQDWTDQSSC